MKALVDTNIVLDVVLRRWPFFIDSSEVIASVERGEVDGVLCSTSVTTIYYVASKKLGGLETRERIWNMLTFFDVAMVDRSALRRAVRLDFRDFEDAVLHEAALEAKADAIVTRNPADFRTSVLPVYTPEEFLNVLHGSGPA